jgi:hypothetical protein
MVERSERSGVHIMRELPRVCEAQPQVSGEAAPARQAATQHIIQLKDLCAVWKNDLPSPKIYPRQNRHTFCSQCVEARSLEARIK